MKKLQYEDIEIQVSTFEGIPVMETRLYTKNRTKCPVQLFQPYFHFL